MAGEPPPGRRPARPRPGSRTGHRQRLGARGEQLAADWYVARGYRLVARNWRCREGELDLVVARDGELVFCEVKTRSSDRFGTPAEAVTPAKQRRLRVLAARFLAGAEGAGAGSAGAGRGIRFDVAAVTGGRVDVIEAAF
ncbi:MAG TPA: YraN family protein [Acidimicrobiales bacterium]